MLLYGFKLMEYANLIVTLKSYIENCYTKNKKCLYSHSI